jgi:pimeloyl-ACP methyl ester carboxylesterase
MTNRRRAAMTSLRLLWIPSLTALLILPLARLEGAEAPPTTSSELQPRLFEGWRARTEARAEAAPGCGAVGVQPSGALYQICMPSLLPWNGELVVYAHGYVSPMAPLEISHEAELIVGAITVTGRAFASTSYRSNGLAVLDALEDLRELLEIFNAEQGAPARVYLVGGSLGGLIATIAVESQPESYDGALAMCGPYGSLAAEIDYLSDFRVVFDYLFPGLVPPSAVAIPGSLMESWAGHYDTAVRPAVESPENAARVSDLLPVTGAAFDPVDPATREATVSGLLWYNVFATNEVAVRLGGQPYDNTTRVYQGSSQDDALNAGVTRYAADAVARAEIADRYEATGRLQRPLVMLHTTGDPIVPYWQVPRYEEKVAAEDRLFLFDSIGVERYGHCNFEPLELMTAFGRLVELVDLQN